MDRPKFTLREFIKFLDKQSDELKDTEINYIDLSNPLWTDNDWEITFGGDLPDYLNITG